MSDQKTKYIHYLCIHGHFYQPPRENPWLDLIEKQKSAHPYHNWNERITRECYGPNARSRLLGLKNRILELVNNYEFMSFNFGPTLLAWLENHDPWLYSQIISADHLSRNLNAGHGNAIAQVYNHIIMPLANPRDKQTQIRWGIEDFRYRFGRMPEGMWLAETAVDTETLGLMTEEGIKFTILSPTQAKAVRLIRRDRREQKKTGDILAWKDVSNGNIDTTRPYRFYPNKNNQKFIDIFFYDSSLSRGIAYEKLLASGSDLLGRIEQKCESTDGIHGLINIATDGESYGHHFKFGEMALTWVIRNIERSGKIKMTNYGNYLEMFPPEMEVRIIENSSWSCSHGIERWRSDCGCNTGSHVGWNQKWRTPLRDGLNNLAADLAQLFDNSGGKLFRNPWAARDDYIHVILNPSKENSLNFVREHLKTEPDRENEIRALQLLESQRMSLYMFTSCGWFFDDISGLEPAQVLMYASRAIDITKNLSGKKLEADLIKTLKNAKSNDPAYSNGADIYLKIVKRHRMPSSRIAAHFAFNSLLNIDHEKPWFLADITSPDEMRPYENNGCQGFIGVVEITDKRIWKRCAHSFIVMRQYASNEHLCLVGEDPATDTDFLMNKATIFLEGGSEAGIEKTIQPKLKGVKRYFLQELIPDCLNLLACELALVLTRNIKETLSSSEEIIQKLIYLIRSGSEPASEIIDNFLHFHLVDCLERLMKTYGKEDLIEFDELNDLIESFSPPFMDTPNIGSKIDRTNENDLKQTINLFLRSQMKGLAKSSQSSYLENLINIIPFFEKLGINPDLWECQNMFYDLLKNHEFLRGLSSEKAIKFHKLGHLFNFGMEEKQYD